LRCDLSLVWPLGLRGSFSYAVRRRASCFDMIVSDRHFFDRGQECRRNETLFFGSFLPGQVEETDPDSFAVPTGQKQQTRPKVEESIPVKVEFDETPMRVELLPLLLESLTKAAMDETAATGSMEAKLTSRRRIRPHVSSGLHRLASYC